MTNLAVLAASGGDPRVKRAVTVAGLVFVVPLTVVFMVVPILPALIVFGVTALLLTASLATSSHFEHGPHIVM